MPPSRPVPISLYSGTIVFLHKIQNWDKAIGTDLLPSLILFFMASMFSMGFLLFAILMDIEYTRGRRKWIRFPEDPS